MGSKGGSFYKHSATCPAGGCDCAASQFPPAARLDAESEKRIREYSWWDNEAVVLPLLGEIDALREEINSHKEQNGSLYQASVSLLKEIDMLRQEQEQLKAALDIRKSNEATLQEYFDLTLDVLAGMIVKAGYPRIDDVVGEEKYKRLGELREKLYPTEGGEK